MYKITITGQKRQIRRYYSAQMFSTVKEATNCLLQWFDKLNYTNNEKINFVEGTIFDCGDYIIEISQL